MGDLDQTVGVLGGTGALGRGLAARWARSGLPVAIGSRDPDRARHAADELTAQLGAGAATITAGSNVEVASSDVVVLSVPWAGLDQLLPDLATPTTGRIVVSAVNPLAFDDDGPHSVAVEEGSVAQMVAAALPGATVAAAFHTVSSRVLGRWQDPLDDDVAIVADDESAATTVAALVDRIEGARGVVVGPLRLASVLEQLTPVLIGINRRAKTHAGIRFSRL